MTVLMYQITLFLLTAVNFLFSAKIAGASVFGLTFAIIAILSVLTDVVDFGRSNWIYREFASERIDKFQFVFFWKLRFKKMLRVTAILMLLGSLFKIELNFWILSLYPMTWLMATYAQSYFSAKSDFHTSGFLNIAEKLFYASFLLIGYISEIEPSFVLSIAIVGSTAFHSTLGAFIAVHRFKEERLKFQHYRVELDRNAANFMGTRSLLTDLLVLDLPVVNALLGSKSAGIYGVGIKLRNPLTVGFTSVLTEIYPLIASSNFEKISTVYRRLRIILSLNCIGIVFVALFFQFGEIEKILGRSYLQFTTISMPILLANIFFGFISLKSGLLVASREEAKVFRLTLLTSLFLLIAIVLTARFGNLELVAWTYLSIMIFNFLIFKAYKLIL